MRGRTGGVWILAARPKTLFATVAPVVMGLAMAADEGAFHVGLALVTLGAALLIQLGTNLYNDYADYMSGADTIERKGPLRVVHAGLVSPRAAHRAAWVAFAAATVGGLYLAYRSGWWVLVIGAAGIIAGIWYSAGRYSLARIGAADIVVLGFFGPIAVGCTYYIQVLQISPVVLVAGLAPGLLSVAVLLVNNIRDMEEDRTAGKRTLVVRLGRRFGIGAWAACVVLAATIPLDIVLLTNTRPWAGIAFIIVLPAMHILYRLYSAKDPRALNPLLGATGALLLAHSVIFSVGWLL